MKDKELVWRLLGYLSPYRFWMLLATLILIATKIVEAAIPLFIGYVSQQILQGTAFDLAKINLEGMWIIGVLIIAYLFDAFNVGLKSWIGQKAVYTLRNQVFDHIQKLPMAYYDHSSVGRLMTRTIHDVEQINLMFSDSVVPLFGSLVLFLTIFAALFYLNVKVALLVVALLPFVYLALSRFRRVQRQCFDLIRSIVAQLNAFVQEQLMGIGTIRAFGLQSQERKEFEKINFAHQEAYGRAIHNFSFFVSSIDFFQNTALILAFIVFFQGQFEPAAFFTFVLYAMMIFRPLTDMAEKYNTLQSAIAAAERIFTVMDVPIEGQLGEEAPDTFESLEFDNVWFAYEKEDWILKGLSFTLKRGESIAVVGVTGAGKTTLISLILRFYEIQKGEIRINGKNARHFSLHSLRKLFSVVFQDPILFSGSLAENIALYDKSIRSEQIASVVDYVNLGEFVDQFPDGIHHHLSERGTGLSAGQMQLVSFARAVAHERQVLILDEATANIDTVTEKLIQDALRKILQDKTALIIAHRLSTIKDASHILVMDQGRVVERGTHVELIEKKGIYSNLYKLQFEI